MDEGRPPERAATLESVSSTSNTILVVVVLTFVLMVITLALVIWLLVRSLQSDSGSSSSVNLQPSMNSVVAQNTISSGGKTSLVLNDTTDHATTSKTLGVSPTFEKWALFSKGTAPTPADGLATNVQIGWASLPSHTDRRNAFLQRVSDPVPIDHLPPLPPDPVQNRYLVLFKVDSATISAVAARNDPQHTHELCLSIAKQYHLSLDHVYHYLYMGFSSVMSAQLAQAIAANENVTQVIPDVLYRKCPYSSSTSSSGKRVRPSSIDAPVQSPPPSMTTMTSNDLVHSSVKQRFAQGFNSSVASRTRRVKSGDKARGWTKIAFTKPNAPSVFVQQPSSSSLPQQTAQSVHGGGPTNTAFRINKTTVGSPMTTSAIVTGSHKSSVLLRPPRPWGLDRIGACSTALHGCEVKSEAADHSIEAEICVFDTGVDPFNPNLDVIDYQSFVPWETDPYDYDGHGTHVAGTAAGIGVGVAPGARVRNIKVLDRTGRGSLATVLAGLDYVVGLFVERQNNDKNSGVSVDVSDTCVVNLSLALDIKTSTLNVLDQALSEAQAFGLHIVTAAGNTGRDLRTVSPAHTPGILVAAAYDETNSLAVWSNSSAQCINAPGSNILSFFPKNKTSLLSGTSHAAAHVSGTVALYASQHPALTPVQVRNALIQASLSAGTVQNPHIQQVPAGSSVLSIYNPYK